MCFVLPDDAGVDLQLHGRMPDGAVHEDTRRGGLDCQDGLISSRSLAKAALLIKLAWTSMLGTVAVAHGLGSWLLARFIHARITCIILGDGKGGGERCMNNVWCASSSVGRASNMR